MPRTIDGESLRHVRALFEGGAGRGRSDGQLLERFVARDGPAAERAFAILVERHGPMVRRVCLAILRDRDAADDAFQAAFLALARRAGSLWVRDSIGPWLHAVSVRVSTRMRADLARRRRLDERAAALTPTSFEPTGPDDLGAALHEEIALLPDRHRLPIVLCLVEGRSHDEAARRLGWPVGTVRSRLARARDRLRDRLSRRGLAPSAIPAGLGLLRPAPEAVRASLAAATARAAVSFSNGGPIAAAGTVPAAAIAAAIGVSTELTMIHRALLILGLVASGLLAAGASYSAQSKPEPAPAPLKPRLVQRPVVEGRSMVRVYAVADLVMQDPRLARAIEPAGGGKGHPVMSTAGVDFGPLVDLITATVAPGTWVIKDPEGGDAPTGPEASDSPPTGSITPFYLNCSLIVRHSPEVHDEVIERLRQLRRLVGPLTGKADEIEERRDISSVPEAEYRVRRAPKADARAAFEAEAVDRIRKLMEATAAARAEPIETFETFETFEREAAGPGESASADRRIQEQRIDSLERKLDAILDELRALRNADR